MQSFRTCATLAFATGVLLLLPAHAHAQYSFVDINGNIFRQLTAVPEFYKQITVVVSLVMTVTGIHGIYKGGADPRSAAPIKNIFLIIIGGLMLAISSVALIAERSTFGTNAAVTVSGSRNMDNQLSPFKRY